jgi:hypothetical protein
MAWKNSPKSTIWSALDLYRRVNGPRYTSFGKDQLTLIANRLTMHFSQIRPFLLLFVLVVSLISINAQAVNELVVLVADKGDFSVMVPKSFLAHKEATQIAAYYRGDGVSGSVLRGKTDGLERMLWVRPQPNDKTAYQSLEFEGFSVIRAVSTRESGSYWETIHIGSNDRYYSVSAHGKDVKDPKVRIILDSIRLKGRLLFRNATFTDPSQAPSVDIAQLETSPDIKEALKRPDALATVTRYEKLGDDNDADDGVSGVYSRQLTILRKEKASYTSGARDKGVKGSIRGRILFKADGTIGEIVMDPTLDKGLARNAADSARRIKFLPAEIDGKPVDQWRPITYTFDIY